MHEMWEPYPFVDYNYNNNNNNNNYYYYYYYYYCILQKKSDTARIGNDS